MALRRWSAEAFTSGGPRGHPLASQSGAATSLDDEAALMRDMGIPLFSASTDKELLDDYVDGPITADSVAGETYLPWTATRWVGGVTRTQQFGLWDRDKGGGR